MTRQPLSTRRSVDDQPTTAVSRRSSLATELLALAAALTAALAAAWVLSQPLLGLATLAGLATALHVAWRLRRLAARDGPTPLRRVAELAGR